jgi:hypothetical protein
MYNGNRIQDFLEDDLADIAQRKQARASDRSLIFEFSHTSTTGDAHEKRVQFDAECGRRILKTI